MSETNGSGNKALEQNRDSKKALTIKRDSIEALTAKFLVDVRTNGGIASHAFKSSGLKSAQAYKIAKENPEFAASWQEALEYANDQLAAEAIRRGVKGEVKYSIDKRGRRRAYREKSDTLLIFMIKRGDVRSKWKKRIIQAGNKALEAVREDGAAAGLTEEQIRAIQNGIIREFDKIPLT